MLLAGSASGILPTSSSDFLCMREHPEARQQIASGVLLGIAHNRDVHTEAPCSFAFGHGFSGVIGSLGVHVRAEDRKQARHVGILEYGDVTYWGQSGHETSASIGGKYRPALTFQQSHAAVRIDRHDEHVS